MSLVVHPGEIVLRFNIPLLGSLSVPSKRFLVVLRGAMSFCVHELGIELRFHIPLFSKDLHHLQCSRVVTRAKRPTGLSPILCTCNVGRPN